MFRIQDIRQGKTVTRPLRNRLTQLWQAAGRRINRKFRKIVCQHPQNKVGCRVLGFADRQGDWRQPRIRFDTPKKLRKFLERVVV